MKVRERKASEKIWKINRKKKNLTKNAKRTIEKPILKENEGDRR